MSRAAKSMGAATSLAMALTWDGARWPVRSLPPKARAFLKAASASPSSPASSARLLATGKVREIRICWVPRLRGGDDVLATPFLTPTGRRVAFRCVKTVALGDVLGAIYRPGS